MKTAPYRLAELAAAVRTWQDLGERVALCHGCFDILHYGHALHLAAARAIADRLVVTVTPDRYVRKGSGRPVFTAEQRLYLLASLRVVDGVALNEWPTAAETMRVLRPDMYVKGIDYAGVSHVGLNEEREAAAALGIEMRFTPTPKCSTTEILERIRGAQAPQPAAVSLPSV